MDKRCVSYDKKGKIQNYDEALCVIAYLVADRQHLQAEIEDLKQRVH